MTRLSILVFGAMLTLTGCAGPSIIGPIIGIVSYIQRNAVVDTDTIDEERKFQEGWQR